MSDVERPIIGFRAWRVTDDLRLYSAGMGDTVWLPGVNVATCGQGEHHEAPDGDCECGLYARYDLAPAYGEIRGIVRAWGHVELQPSIFRAQYAEIVGLVYTTARDRLLAEAIAGDYGAEVVRLDECGDPAGVQAFVDRFGMTVPEDLRPEMPIGVVPTQGIATGAAIQISGTGITNFTISGNHLKGDPSGVPLVLAGLPLKKVNKSLRDKKLRRGVQITGNRTALNNCVIRGRVTMAPGVSDVQLNGCIVEGETVKWDAGAKVTALLCVLYAAWITVALIRLAVTVL